MKTMFETIASGKSLPTANTSIRAIYPTWGFVTLASGNASGPGAGTPTADAVVMSIAEASDGYINAAEKASNGGVPISISLPHCAAAMANTAWSMSSTSMGIFTQ